MNKYQPSRPYRLVDVRLAFPENLSEEEITELINEHLSAKMAANGERVSFADWQIMFRNVRYTSRDPKDGDLFAFMGQRRVKVMPTGERSRYKVVIRFANGPARATKHRTLTGAEAKVQAGLNAEDSLNATIYEYIPRKKGKPDWSAVKGFDSNGKVMFDRNAQQGLAK